MHLNCPHCSFVADGDSSVVNKILQQHIKREHEQGYRPLSSWGNCRYCGGRGKDTNGITCKYCNGSGIA